MIGWSSVDSIVLGAIIISIILVVGLSGCMKIDNPPANQYSNCVSNCHYYFDTFSSDDAAMKECMTTCGEIVNRTVCSCEGCGK
jgi:outer membrane murein-binding lipoprotein Lpp